MELKLAQYNEDGQFEKFLEIDKDFYYHSGRFSESAYGSRITVKSEPNYTFHLENHPFYYSPPNQFPTFDGLFYLRNYNQGRFVLKINDDFDVFAVDQDGAESIFISYEGQLCKKLKRNPNRPIQPSFPLEKMWPSSLSPSIKKIGNIFENPELYEKIK